MRTDNAETRSAKYNARASPRPKTLVFCTAFGRTLDVWNIRYRRWISAIRGSSLEFDKILLIDDGSPILPDWADVAISPPDPTHVSDELISLVHFPDNLGRWPGHNYPGWYRSYAFAAEYGKSKGFDKIIHIESDSFIIGNSVSTLFNNIKECWATLWDSFYEMPETAIQVASGSGVELYFEATRHPYSKYIHNVIERVLPFTDVIKSLKGGKYPVYLNYVPTYSDFVVQATENFPSDYFWWLSPTLPYYESKGNYLGIDGLQPTSPNEFRPLQSSRLLTSHGTVVYSNADKWRLRHGPIEESPTNVWLIHDAKRGMIEFRDGADHRLPLFTATDSYIMTKFERERVGGPLFIFDIVKFPDGVGLKSGERFLCADQNGHMGLSRYQCLKWERFELRDAE